MTSVILHGGLGNQLFQYATGRAHSLRTDSPLYMNMSQFHKDRGPDVAERSLNLDAFDLPVEYVNNSSTWGPNWKLFERLPQTVATVSQPLATRLFNLYVEDRSLRFDPHVVQLPSDIILDGYWQSEQYFSDFDEKLRNEIFVHNSISDKNRQWYDCITDTDSVSVHVRRGDYVSLGWALPSIYYRNALNRIYNKTDVTDLFFFSDDMNWVRTNCEELLPEERDINVHYIECNNGETAYEDLRLMRSCDHHIIANSSFSWWGAWLDKSNQKQIVAPNFWVYDQVDNLDIVPNRWETAAW